MLSIPQVSNMYSVKLRVLLPKCIYLDLKMTKMKFPRLVKCRNWIGVKFLCHDATSEEL